MEAQVYFIGAGPGDPDLITVKGRAIIEQADVIIYAGSLVNPAIIAVRKQDAAVWNSASLTLPEITEIMINAVRQGMTVARVHTGDPSIYGAVREQMDILRQAEIPFTVIPGVSSFLGAAAAMRQEYTLPGVSQTVILTRRAGRTPVPELQSIGDLAVHQASMVIFLSGGMLAETVQELMTAYPAATPAAVIYRATWPDEIQIHGTLADIAAKASTAGIEKTALLLVGAFLGNEYEPSALYSPGFSHGFRQAEKDDEG